jgi:hypothetical protein
LSRFRQQRQKTGFRSNQNLPVAIGRPPDALTVIYEAVGRRWRLWWPCENCGGTVLALRQHPGARDPASTRQICAQRCPGCESRRRRREVAQTEPSVWYDTSLGDWVVRLPCQGVRGGVLLPLEIPWFDAPWSEVYRTAGDVAYGSDALRHLTGDELPDGRRGADGSS